MTLNRLASSTSGGFQCEKCQSEITYAEKIATTEGWHVAKYAFTMKSIDDAMILRNEICYNYAARLASAQSFVKY